MKTHKKKANTKIERNSQKAGSKIFTKYLRFIDFNLETSFLESRALQQLKFFRFFCFTLATLSTLIFIANPFEKEFKSSLLFIPFLSTLSFLAIAYLIVVHKLQKKAESGLAVTSVIYGIFEGEALKQLIDNEGKEIQNRWITDAMLLVIGAFIIGTRMRWLYSGMTLLIIHSYISIRVWNDLINLNRVLPNVLGLILYGLLIPKLNYSNEEEERRFFYRIHQKRENLKAFHVLIKKVLPSSMILLDAERIKFFNNRIREMFGVKDENDLINIMRMIEVKINRKR